VQAITSFVLGVGLTAIEANRGTLCLLTPDGLSLEVAAHNGYDCEDPWVEISSLRRSPVLLSRAV